MSGIEAYAARLAGGDIAGVAAFGVAFLGGLVAGFGPCVLPMMPAIFGYVTGRVAEETDSASAAWRRGLVLSAVFVVGMSVVFAAIGAAAGALGRAIVAGAWANYLVAAICVVLGLQMLGLINLHFEALNRVLPRRRPTSRGLVGTFAFGMVFGAVASPCSTPILAAIATIAAARGSAPEGAALLFVYGLGKGVPLLLLGVASGSLTLMRRFTRASGVLTRVGGAGLLVAAAYLIWIA